MKFRERSTTDMLILGIAATICFVVLGSGIAIAFVEIRDPSADTSAVVGTLSDTINTLIGLLAGFLAGRTESTVREMDTKPPREKRPPRDEQP